MAYTIRNGNEGLAVLKLQGYLNSLRTKYPTLPLLAVDGKFGANTENAVRLFQRSTGLVADGIIGTLTWDKILTEYKNLSPTPTPPTTNTLSYGSTGLEVMKMQGYLNQLMPNTVPLVTDGVYGTKTEAKVIQFQMQNNLTADGKLGTQTWDRIIQLL